MAHDPDPDPANERRRLLDEVRAEIEGRLASGQTLDPALYRARHAALEPELGAILAGLAADQPTIGAGGSTSAVVRVEETVALSGSAPPTSAPTDAGATLPLSGTLAESMAQGATRAEAVGALAETVAGLTNELPPGALDDTVAATPPAAGRAPANGQAALAPGQKVRYIGDYEAISVLGQGGMGVVYKARQISLNRLVALKMIRDAEFAGEEAVRRFQNEAEAVATLDHPGIVPIYEVGQYEDQRYFSMKLIEGMGFDKRVKRAAVEPREAAALVAEVAEAVHHAHQRGILHRDLKPANILLDGQGHAHVTDFGLAKRIEEDAGITVTGAIMGTPAYMAPEQAMGHTAQITTASDVYGLGAILYAALTGRAPFVSDSVLITLDQVRNNPPEPPTKLKAGLPRDLEVICLKCLEKDARHRYASARDLAEDLYRWLRGEPITARPVGSLVRAWMWAKRKPALAGLSAGLVLALLAGMVGIAWQWREAVFQRDRALTEEQAARKAEGEALTAQKSAVASEKVAVGARAQAEQNATIAGMQATLALGTVQDLVAQVQKGLGGEPGLFDLKTNLIEAALKRIDGVANIYERSTSKEATTAAALMELGKIYRQLGQSEKALRSFLKCLEITKERVKIKNYSDPSRQNLANTYFELAFCSEELRRDMKATLNYNQEGLKLYQEIESKPMLADHPIDRKIVRAGLAEAYTRVGVTLSRMGEMAPALDNYRKAYNLRRELADEFKDNPAYRQDLSYSLMALADTSFRMGDRTLADDYYRQTLDIREALATLNAKDLKVQKELGDVHYMIGEFKLRSRDLAAARRHLERSREIRSAVVDREKRDVLFRRDLGMTLYRLGNLADLEKNPDAARLAFEATAKIREELAQISENNDRRQMELMQALAHVARVDRATELADRLAAGPNVDRELRIDLARCYAQVARALPPAQAERAQTALVKAVETLRAAIREGFRDRVYLETEPDLDPLRARDDFKGLIREIGGLEKAGILTAKTPRAQRKEEEREEKDIITLIKYLN